MTYSRNIPQLNNDLNDLKFKNKLLDDIINNIKNDLDEKQMVIKQIREIINTPISDTEFHEYKRENMSVPYFEVFHKILLKRIDKILS
jgi:hypothetical protein